MSHNGQLFIFSHRIMAESDFHGSVLFGTNQAQVTWLRGLILCVSSNFPTSKTPPRVRTESLSFLKIAQSGKNFKSEHLD